MSDQVAVLGGGVGGLSAAHELIERGFDVTVYEKKDVFRTGIAPGSPPGERRTVVKHSNY